MAAPVPIRPLVADRQSIRDGHAERRSNTLTDIRHEGVRKISRKTRSPSERPTTSTDLTNSAALLNCRRSTLRAPRHDSPDCSRASRRAPPRSSFRHAKTFSRTNFAQHKHSACVCVCVTLQPLAYGLSPSEGFLCIDSHSQLSDISSNISPEGPQVRPLSSLWEKPTANQPLQCKLSGNINSTATYVSAELLLTVLPVWMLLKSFNFVQTWASYLDRGNSCKSPSNLKLREIVRKVTDFKLLHSWN
jgi:hypothetical protein